MRNRVMMTRWCACLVLVAFIAACSTSVTSNDVPITSQSQKTAADSIHIADLTGQAVVQFLISAHIAGSIPRSVLDTYERDIGPPLQAALDTSRQGLQRAIATSDPDVQAQLAAQVATLLDLLNDVVTFAQQHGWVGR